MIHRPNYEDVQAFLAYQRETMQRDPKTVHRYWVSLRVLLEWADSTPFPECKSVRPTFPKHVSNKPSQRDGGQCSYAHMERILKDSRVFFNWTRREYPSRYKLAPTWVDSLRLPRTITEKQGLKKVEAWTLQDVLKIAALPTETLPLTLQRTQASVAFLFLSGMRITAFVTLPINCVDIAGRKVEQLPSKGVETKNRKAAVTTLLPIPELLTVVEAWDTLVRGSLPATSPWYALTEWSYTEGVTKIIERSGNAKAMAMGFPSNLRQLCDMTGVPYKSAHKLRHGHAVFGIKYAKTIQELKAISQNLMHSNISITDGVYGNLTSDDIQTVIATLGGNAKAPMDKGTALPIGALTSAQVSIQEILDNPELKKQLLAALLTQVLG